MPEQSKLLDIQQSSFQSTTGTTKKSASGFPESGAPWGVTGSGHVSCRNNILGDISRLEIIVGWK